MRPRRQVAALAAVSAVLPVGAAACGGSNATVPAPGPAGPSSPHRSEPLTSVVEDPDQLFANPAGTLDKLRALGVATVRVYVAWSSLAPTPSSKTLPAGFDPSSPSAYPAAGWRPYDTIVEDATKRGIEVMLTLKGPSPLWAAGPGAPPGTPSGGADWKPSKSAFGSFVRAVGTRYSGAFRPPGASSPLPRVEQWSIWNEPNYGPELAPQAIDDSTVEASPALYRKLLQAAWGALEATGHAHDTIVIGELAPRGITGPGHPGNFSGMVPLRFLRALYCVDRSLSRLQGKAAASRGCPATAAASRAFADENPALFRASGVALHPYSQGAVPPTFVTPDEPDYADLASLPRAEALLDRLTDAYGSRRRLPVYSTEYGYKTNPPQSLGAPMASAALYENWAEYLSWRDPRLRTWDQYLLVDPPPNASRFVTGLEFSDGSPKPTLAAWRMPIFVPRTAASRGRALEIWGCARPVRYATGAQSHRVAIQFRRDTGGPFTTVMAVKISPEDCYFDVPVRLASSGTVRLKWSTPGYPPVHSRPVRVTVS